LIVPGFLNGFIRFQIGFIILEGSHQNRSIKTLSIQHSFPFMLIQI